MEKTLLTIEGLNRVKEELEFLKNNERPRILKELVEARSHGDLSENADYDAARNRQAEIESKIKELENAIDTHVIINEEQLRTDIVSIASIVTIIDLSDNTKDIFKIVGKTEADPKNKRISNDSPLGKALIGKKVNDECFVKSVEPYTVKIIKIERE